MAFVGRSAELGALRAALDRRQASVLRVCGVRGGGKSALVERTLVDYPHLLHRFAPFPDPFLRQQLMERVTAARSERRWPPHLDEGVPPWPDLLEGLLQVASSGGRPFALVLDDVHRLEEARSRHLPGVLRLVAAAREQGRPLHVVLVGPRSAMPPDDALPEGSPPPLQVGPLPLRSARALLPGTRPLDLIRAYGVFGGIPRVLRCLDRDAALGTNVRRLVLTPGAVLADVGEAWLERDVQAPARYYAILATLADGEADWASVNAGVPDLTRSGQVAPYLGRLELLGLLQSRRSLDASERSRARRYALADPFLATWVDFVLRAGPTAGGGDNVDSYAARVRPSLDLHVARAFPVVCRQHMAHDALETIGETARQGGSLWGPGYDIPVAGILSYGSAYYGACLWRPDDVHQSVLETLDSQIRETRYGFGRERRLRLIFTGNTAPARLQREVARRHDAHLIDAAALVGD